MTANITEFPIAIRSRRRVLRRTVVPQLPSETTVDSPSFDVEFLISPPVDYEMTLPSTAASYAVRFQVRRQWISRSLPALIVAMIVSLVAAGIGELIHSSTVTSGAIGYLAGLCIAYLMSLHTWQIILRNCNSR